MMKTMGFCQEHWNELRQEVSNQGLDHLVSANAEVAVTRAIGDSDDPAMFDPLMFAMWALIYYGSKVINRPLILTDGCPICELLNEHERTCNGDPQCRTVEEVSSWPRKAAEAARDRYNKLEVEG